MIGGVQKTTDFLDKSTWTLGTILIVLIMLSSLSFGGSLSDTESKIIDQTQTTAPKAKEPTKEAAPNAASTTPVTPAPVAPEKK